MTFLQSQPMAAQVEGDEPCHGSLVAFEGDADKISTQLRLLPPSSKILMLPSLNDSVSVTEKFNARAFVRDVHTAFSDRTAMARSFLKSSTVEQPRLAFVNGGCVSARTMCVTAICERVTNGEIREAEAIFQDIVKDGVAGLMTAGDDELPEEPKEVEETAGDVPTEEREFDGVVQEEHPNAVAMKAAESLDRITFSLQSHENGEHTGDSQLSKSSPGAHGKALAYPDSDIAHGRLKLSNILRPYSNEYPPMSQVVDTNEHGDVIKRSVLNIPSPKTTLKDRRNKFNLSPLSPFTPRTEVSDARSTQELIEDMDRDSRLLSPSTHNRNSFPLTPAVLGEAYLVDVQSAAGKTKTMRRVRSLDRFPHNLVEPMPVSSGQHSLRHVASARHLRKTERDASGDLKDIRSVTAAQSFESLPRTMFVKASETVIKKSPTLTLSPVAAKAYVDRGTDPVAEESKEEEAVEFEPVFPVLEDLIIYFTGQFHDIIESEIFDAVVRSYVDGSYPALPTPEMTFVTAPSRSSFVDEVEDGQTTPVSHSAPEIQDETHIVQEIDPYNPDSYTLNGSNEWRLKGAHKNFALLTAKREPLTPATTPPVVRSELAQKFHEISSTNSMTAMGVQNAIRAVLNIHFSPETTNYRQYTFPAENDRFWKPVFQYDNNLGDLSRTVDQIIAIGCEDGVKQELFSEVTGQIEKMGTKKNGQSRSGRLDIRYLITLAFHSYASSCLPYNAPSLLTTPSLLSTLLIPQLEVYLSNMPSIRLLILTYPASQLSTMLHLRKGLGSDIFKIAGIIDSLASDPPPASKSLVSPLSNDSVSALNGKPRQRAASPTLPSTTRSASFAHADFLLPSHASPAETSTFLQTLLSTLVAKSDYYLPEPPSIPVEASRPKTPGGTNPSVETPRPKTAASINSVSSITKNSLSKAARMLVQNSTVGRLGSAQRTGSRGRSGTVGSEKARERERQSELEWESFYVGGESDEDEMERILMPRVVKRTERKANSRKALKFLGLA